MWRYARALDSNNPDAYAAVYTVDGQFGTGANATKGREALKKMIADLKQRNAEADAKSGGLGTLIIKALVKKLDARDIKKVQLLYKAEDSDFRLKPGSAAVDKGVALPNITDGFAGKAPDLGALELGQAPPRYGPRP